MFKYGVWYSESTWKVLQINEYLFLEIKPKEWFNLLVSSRLPKSGKLETSIKTEDDPDLNTQSIKPPALLVIWFSKASSAFLEPNEWEEF